VSPSNEESELSYDAGRPVYIPPYIQRMYGSAGGGRPNPHMGLRLTGSPPLSGCARPAWFPDGYRISVSPIVGPSTKPRGSGAPASKLGLPDSGGGLATRRVGAAGARLVVPSLICGEETIYEALASLKSSDKYRRASALTCSSSSCPRIS